MITNIDVIKANDGWEKTIIEDYAYDALALAHEFIMDGWQVYGQVGQVHIGCEVGEKLCIYLTRRIPGQCLIPMEDRLDRVE